MTLPIIDMSRSFVMGHAYILLKRYEEALDKLLVVLDRVPGLVPARVQQARAYGEMGRIPEARIAIEKLGEVAPRYKIGSAHRMFPYPDSENRTRLNDGLRKAGLRE